MLGPTLCLFYGIVAYVAFLGTFLYAIGFFENIITPTSIDSGRQGPYGEAVLINLSLLGLFGVQHSIMARSWFKSWWTTIIPKSIERSTFVLITSIILGLMFWQWRPMAGIVWQADAAALRAILTVLSLLGWLVVLYATFIIDHFDLFGLRQVYLHWRGRDYTPPRFVEGSLYGVVRHPLMTGFLMAFWFTPTMTHGHLLFAGVTTIYVLVAVRFEERDLVRLIGPAYGRYRERTPMILPFPRRGRAWVSKPEA
jgi:protein-S-isoprenylcysteine O-methyltransferase Ste14